jgi:DNA repair and recombination protein RAD54B
MSLGKRDGQKHPVFIYRFLTAGTIDGGLSNKNKTQTSYIIYNLEKIFQRQVTKLGLSNCRFGAVPYPNYC